MHDIGACVACFNEHTDSYIPSKVLWKQLFSKEVYLWWNIRYISQKYTCVKKIFLIKLIMYIGPSTKYCNFLTSTSFLVNSCHISNSYCQFRMVLRGETTIQVWTLVFLLLTSTVWINAISWKANQYIYFSIKFCDL